jgi:hypothetical protein
MVQKKMQWLRCALVQVFFGCSFFTCSFSGFLPVFTEAAMIVAVVKRPAAANSTIFFMVSFLSEGNHGQALLSQAAGPDCLFKVRKFSMQALTNTGPHYQVASTVTPPFTFWFMATWISASRGKKRSTREPNLIKPISSPCSTSIPGFR